MKKIIKNFIFDRKDFIIGYFFNSFLLILFFHLATGKEVEVFYPFIISILIFILIIISQWVKYYKFAGNISKYVINPYYDLQPETLEHMDMNREIQGIHSKFLSDMETIKKENLNRYYFLSQWVHNMKTPVSIIDLILQKALKGQITDKEIIKDIQIENSKLLNGLEQVLGVIRLGEFKNDFVPEAVDLLEELRELINIKKNDFIYNNTFPQIICSIGKVLVLTDKKWNNMLIEQIIANAIKYSCDKAESKRITFKIDQKDLVTTLSIIDQGIGISEYDLKRIFEPFYTGDNGRQLKNATGIGLYMCSEIAKKLGHKLEIKSEPNKGTMCTITYLTKT